MRRAHKKGKTMQANTITLAVDLLNNATTTNKVFSRHSEELNRSVYTGPDHTMLQRQTLGLYRTPPKRAGVFLGAGKTTVKFTFDKSVEQADGTSIIVPMIGEVLFSIPVGVSAADTLAFRQYIVSLLDSDSVMAPLNDSQVI